MDLFRSEVETHAQLLSDALLTLERSPGDTSRIDEMMRAAHSIKGASRVVGVDPAGRVAHALEDCFVAARGGSITLTSGHVDVLLRGVDLLGRISEATRQPDAPLDAAFGDAVQAIVADLHQVLRPQVVGGAGAAASGASPPVPAPAHTAAATAGAATGAARLDEPLTIAVPEILDAATADHVRRNILSAVSSGRREVHFDLSVTRDLDVRGLALLAGVPPYLTSAGLPPPRLAGVSAAMAAVLRVTGVGALYGMRPGATRDAE